MSDASTPSPQTTFKAVVHAEPEGGYWAEVPDLPGCFTQGATLDEVYHNLAEAIACHLDIEFDQAEIDARWAEEAEDRLLAFERGEIRAIPGEEVLASLKLDKA